MTPWLTVESALDFMRANTPLYVEIGKAVRPAMQSGRLSFYCSVCRSVQMCLPSSDWNLRNAVHCQGCGHGGRQRHAYSVIESVLARGAHTRRLIFEEVTPFKALLDERFGRFRGSEYLGPDKRGGVAYWHEGRPIVHEDMCAISLPDASVDLIVSLDVLEHLPDSGSALAECHRVLRPGGYHILTVPFYDARQTIRRAIVKLGQVEHLMPPEFHGNPVSAEGALVFIEPGVDFVDVMRSAGFLVQVSLGANLEFGLFPDANPVPGAHSWNLVFILSKA